VYLERDVVCGAAVVLLCTVVVIWIRFGLIAWRAVEGRLNDAELLRVGRVESSRVESVSQRRLVQLPHH
jgi:hypothetical protein